MFRKLKPPTRIALICPLCGFRQTEPAAVLSTFCRGCAGHYRVHRGQVVAPPAHGPSGIVEARPIRTERTAPVETSGSEPPLQETETPSAKTVQRTGARDQEEADRRSETSGPQATPWLAGPGDLETDARHPYAAEAFEGRPGDLPAGAVFGLVPNEGGAEDNQSAPQEQSPLAVAPLGERALGKEQLAAGNMAALIESQRSDSRPQARLAPLSTPEGTKQAEPPQQGFEVRCFQCYHLQQVSRFAKSTQCERCSTYISLANYDIRAQRSHTLRTRGDIIIRRLGGLRNCEIACHHLTVHGSIDALVDCTGDAVFRRHGVVRGHLHCRKLIVEKGAEIEFPDGAMAECAEIHGLLNGDLTCSGTARIFRHGIVSGDLTAAEVQIKDSGVVAGAVCIDLETSIAPSPKMRYNDAVIG